MANYSLISLALTQLPSGKVWLSPVIDCFDGKVVSWSLGTRPDAELANTMLDGAISTLTEGERPIIHNDRGGHYRWPGWLERVNAASLIRSMSRKGCSPDNAACEGFFGRLKTEMYYGHEWSGVTPEHFMQHVDAYPIYDGIMNIASSYRWEHSARECTVDNSASRNKTVQENIRIPNPPGQYFNA